MYGTHGGYLLIDLPEGTATRHALQPGRAGDVLGGVGLGVHLLLRHTTGNYDALAPAAPLVFAFAPLAGTALNTSAKAAVVCKSPLTGRLNDAMVSSRFALDGKGTGYDALVLRGACAAWSTLFVSPEGVRVLETPALVGLSADETGDALHAEYGDAWSVAAIGVAGEHGVPFATMTHDGRHAGRGGTGAVLGAKRIKAVAVRGVLRPPVADERRLESLRAQLKQRSLGPGTAKYRTTGTLGNLLVFERLGVLPGRNFATGTAAVGAGAAEALSVEGLYEGGGVVRTSCADCMIGCEKRVKQADGRGTRLEYENVFALGPLLGLYDRAAVLAASRRCDELGLDTLSMGGTLAFASECVQRGWLDVPALATLDAARVLEAIELTATRRDYGALLALGSRALAARLGPQAEALAPHVKGLELPGYHPASLQTLGLGLAVGARGADHNKSGAYDLDLSGEVDPRRLDTARIEAMVALEDQAAVIDSLILCKFVRRALGDVYADGAAMLAALTGEAWTAADLHRVARRVHDDRKRFNQRQGWSCDEDTLPERFFAPDGLAADAECESLVQRDAFLEARARYYALRGWTEQGRLASEATHAAVGAEGGPAALGGARQAGRSK